MLSQNISKTTIKGVTYTELEGTLSYLPTVCPCYGTIN